MLFRGTFVSRDRLEPIAPLFSSVLQGVSAFALRVEKRNRIKFSECFGNVIHKPDGAHRVRRGGISM